MRAVVGRQEFEGLQRVYAGFLIDDVSSIDDVKMVRSETEIGVFVLFS